MRNPLEGDGEMDEIDLVRRFRPPPASDEEGVGAARNALMHEIHRAGHPEKVRRSRGVRAGLVVAALAVAISLVAALPALLPSGGGAWHAERAAADVLRDAATVAATQPSTPPLEPGQYVYTRSENAYLSVAMGEHSFAVLVPHAREMWVAPDGSGRLRGTAGEAVFLSAEDRSAWIGAGSPELPGGKTTDEAFGPEGLVFQDLWNLPTGPGELREAVERLVSEVGPTGDSETFQLVGQLLRETYAPPEVRSALYRLMADIPGVELVGDTKDETGRAGVAVAYTPRGVRLELIFDPETSQLIGERQVAVDPGKAGLHVAQGTVIGWAAYLDSRVVDSTATTA